MEKQNLDWKNLGFGYRKTDKRYVSNYKDGKWDNGSLTENADVVINESAGVLHYCQTCFEGMKAYTTKDGQVVVFRPDLNAARMADSARRLEIPVFPEDRFVDAVGKVVKANLSFVPPYGTGAALYIRPVLFATGSVMGVKPANEYQFRIFAAPVGPYFKNGGASSLVLKVSDFDRSAPHGTGHIKAGLNYAMSLYPIVKAHEEGFNENLYLDPQTRTKVEETGGANFFFVTKDNTVVTPKSASILPSITRRSLMTLAKNLGYNVEEREVYLSELKDFAECGLCGTAAVVSPVGKVNDHGTEIVFENSKNGFGPVSKKLYDTLTGIQFGEIEAPEGWIKVIE
ncbi:MAG: branched-chain amino acid aminotransferase [Candidatus Gastranaerophilaceae bacterium]